MAPRSEITSSVPPAAATEFELANVTRMAVNLPAVYALSALAIVAFALSSAPNWFHGVGWIAGLAPFASMLGSAAIFGSLYFANGPLVATTDAGTLRVTEGRIELSGKVLGIASELGSAVLIPSASQGMLVRLGYKKRKQPLTLRVEDITQGRALLRALALDATKTTSTFAVRPSMPGQRKIRRGLIVAALTGAVATVCVPFLAGTGHPSDLFPMLMVGLCVSMAAFIAANVPSKATVGADGILFRYLWSKKFLPLARIHSADVAEGAKERPVARLRLADERKGDAPQMLDVLPLSPGSLFASTAEKNRRLREHASSFIERVVATLSIEHGEEIDSAASAARALSRDTRSVSEWIDSLRALLEQTATFREIPVRVAELWDIVENGKEAATQRAAAAVALMERLDDEGRARLRVVAKATAAPKLRVAFDAAAERDEGRIQEALEDLDREDATAAGR